MAQQNNAEYFRRAEDERVRSRRAIDPRASAAHADLASRYEEMARQLEAKSIMNKQPPASEISRRSKRSEPAA